MKRWPVSLERLFFFSSFPNFIRLVRFHNEKWKLNIIRDILK